MEISIRESFKDSAVKNKIIIGVQCADSPIDILDNFVYKENPDERYTWTSVKEQLELIQRDLEYGTSEFLKTDLKKLFEMLEMEQDSPTNVIELIESKAVAYEQGTMLRHDSEVEIDVIDGEVWIGDYSESRGGAELFEKICNASDITLDELKELCNKHDWYYVL